MVRARLRRKRGRAKCRDGQYEGPVFFELEAALTSRWPARAVLFMTWQRSGGPSSRNVADRNSMRWTWPRTRVKRTKGLSPRDERLSQLDLCGNADESMAI